MKQLTNYKSKKILDTNNSWPLIIEGATSADFPNAIIIPASISSSELGVVPSESGLKYPTWAMKIMIKAKRSRRIIVCIGELDEISIEDQQKFYGLIKYKGVNGFKFPECTQIIITTKDSAKISKRIASLAILYKADK